MNIGCRDASLMIARAYPRDRVSFARAALFVRDFGRELQTVRSVVRGAQVSGARRVEECFRR